MTFQCSPDAPLEAIRKHLPPDVQFSAFADLVSSYTRNLTLAEEALARCEQRQIKADAEAKEAGSEYFTARNNCRRIYAILRSAEKLLKSIEEEFKK